MCRGQPLGKLESWSKKRECRSRVILYEIPVVLCYLCNFMQLMSLLESHILDSHIELYIRSYRNGSYNQKILSVY
jgi:hypothetical protein